MSRHLPERPNLDHLKKQAKELLQAMQPAKLADAQHALANEYGFATWAKLKVHVEELAQSPQDKVTAAVRASDAARVTELLIRNPELRAKVDDPMPAYGFGANALFAAVQRSDRATIDVLLNAGANINKRTEWWAGGFGVLDECHPDLLGFLQERGAVLDAHAAARLDKLPELREMIAADPELVRARGGDGQLPLHFAATVETAEFLLANGAELDARDVDHESTAAQYMLRVTQRRHYSQDRQDVARYLVSRGCRTDLLMAAALGDAELVRRHLDADPGCIRMRVTEKWFPKQDPRAGGTIYIWVLGAYRTAHTVARDFGHEDIFALLIERTPPEVRLGLACEIGDERAFDEMLARQPDLAKTLTPEDVTKLPDAAQSNNTQAVRLMLRAGWPVDTRGDMGATALHWAGFNGNAEMTRDVLQFKPALELKSRDYESTALGWALFGSGNGLYRENADYAKTVEQMVKAGAVLPIDAEKLEPSENVREALGLGS